MKLKPIAQQVVVVVGAASGIGRLTALEFARRGARVVAVARDATALDSLVDTIERGGGLALAVPADVTVPDQMRAVADDAEGAFGGVDTWVNLAAVSVYASFEATTPEEFRKVIEVDLLGYAFACMAALPALRRRGGGALINIASVESRVAMPLHSAYAAAKHGVAGMTDALRVELQHDGAPISVTSIMPAAVDTPFFEHARTKLGVKPRGVPPVYPPEDVVAAIVYAAEHPVRELVVGGAGHALIGLRALSPALVDRVLARVGYSRQTTDEPRSWMDNAFDAPIEGDERIKEGRGATVGRVGRPGFFAVHARASVAGALAVVAALVAVVAAGVGGG